MHTYTEFDCAALLATLSHLHMLIICLDVNFCKDHRNKIEVPDTLAVEDLISSKLISICNRMGPRAIKD